MHYGTLVEAAMNGDANETLLHILWGQNVRAKFDLGNGTWTTLLHLVAFKHQTEVAALLIASGADVNAVDGQGTTPIYMPVVEGDKAMVKLLLEKGADPNARERNRGDTLLHAAAVAGRLDVAELLIAHGADATAKNAVGVPPLLVAVQSGHRAVAELIAKHAST